MIHVRAAQERNTRNAAGLTNPARRPREGLRCKLTARCSFAKSVLVSARLSWARASARCSFRLSSVSVISARDALCRLNLLCEQHTRTRVPLGFCSIPGRQRCASPAKRGGPRIRSTRCLDYRCGSPGVGTGPAAIVRARRTKSR
jgi:hypothetical protein